MDASDLVLTKLDVPDGFTVQEEAQRTLDLGGAYADQAHRAFWKRRLIGYSSAIWSEVTVFPGVSSARDGWQTLADYHRENTGYDGALEVGEQFGDDSYVHTGTMRGKPGLWGLVRRGEVIHRFNTYAVENAVSVELLRRQLAKAPTSSAISDATAVQSSYLGFIDAFRGGDLDQINERWLRLQLAVHKGKFKELQPALDEFREASDGDDQARLKKSIQRLSAAVAALSPE